MGFYLELKKQNLVPVEFREEEIPVSFWFLFLVAGFALACMGAAAYSLFGNLWSTGGAWDKALVLAILSSVPFYLLVGLKLFLVRKFVQLDGDVLKVGYRLGKVRIPLRQIRREQIREVALNNRRPTSNLAPSEHDNPQYYIRGHWRLLVERKNGKVIALDKHTESEALEELHRTVKAWWQHV